MATFSTVPMEEARRALLSPRRATQEQYREYVRGLGADSAGQLELGEGDKPRTQSGRSSLSADCLIASDQWQGERKDGHGYG